MNTPHVTANQSKPDFSIVIVNFNRADMTLRCVAAVAEHTPQNHEVLVVDNGSQPAEAQKLESSASAFRLVKLARNVFFGEANNIGVEHARSDLVLFLNNDVIITSGWLAPLAHVLETESSVGAVGAKLLYPDGTLQEAGAFVREDGWPFQLGKWNLRPLPSHEDGVEIVDYCSAACLLMKRDVFLSLGGFDPLFEPQYFEDCDLAFRLRAIGLFIYYCGRTAVFHHENTTSRQIWSDQQLNKYLSANHAKFFARWEHYLRHRWRDDCDPTPLAPIDWMEEPKSSGQPTVVFYISVLSLSGATERLLKVATAFHEVLDVIIATDDISSRCRIYSLCRHFAIPLKTFRVGKVSDLAATRNRIVFGDNEPPAEVSSQSCISVNDVAALVQLIEEIPS